MHETAKELVCVVAELSRIADVLLSPERHNDVIDIDDAYNRISNCVEKLQHTLKKLRE